MHKLFGRVCCGLVGVLTLTGITLAQAQGVQPNPAADLQACSAVDNEATCSCYQRMLTPEHFSMFSRIVVLTARTDIPKSVKDYQIAALIGGGPGGNMQTMFIFQSGLETAQKACRNASPAPGSTPTTPAPAPAPTFKQRSPEEIRAEHEKFCADARTRLAYLNEDPARRDPSGTLRQGQEFRLSECKQ